jgi:hypothetical protein
MTLIGVNIRRCRAHIDVPAQLCAGSARPGEALTVVNAQVCVARKVDNGEA